MGGITVEEWSENPGVLSEGPRWHEERGELLWVDILESRLHRATLGPDQGLEELATVALDRHVGAVAPATAGGYVVAAGVGFLHVAEDGSVREMAQPAAGNPGVRMNDGACDQRGRFWAGTMAYDETPGAGALYRLELDGRCSTMLTGLTISNGVGWSPDGTTMYLADSGTSVVHAFAVDPETGDLGTRRTFCQIAEAGAVPDGLTVDAEGDVWVALHGGGAVRCYRADGRPVVTVHLPVSQPTSCAFGGPDLGTLFVTSAREGLSRSELEDQPGAGLVYRVDGTGVRGQPVLPYRGTVPGGPGR
jgi:sugar lactone lactonase YvrE